MNLRFQLIILSAFLSFGAFAQDINWVSAETAFGVASEQQQKVILFIEDASNQDCASFKSRALTRAATLAIINARFSAVKISSNTDAIKAFTEAISQVSTQNYEGLEQLSKNAKNDQLQVPVIVIFDKKLQILQKFEGYKSPLEFEKIVTFFGKDYYKSVPWSKFESTYDKR